MTVNRCGNARFASRTGALRASTTVRAAIGRSTLHGTPPS